MRKPLTPEAFRERVKSIVGDEYTVVGDYQRAAIPILFRHNSDYCDNNEFMLRPNDFTTNKQRCPACSRTGKMTTEQFKKRVFSLVGDQYTVLGEYDGTDVQLLIRHNSNNCENHEYMVAPNNFLNHGNRCPKCSNNTETSFIGDVYKDVGNEYTVKKGTFKGITKKVTITHNTCNHTWNPIASNFLHKKTRCPHCFVVSKGEELIKKFLEEHINNKTHKFKREVTFKSCKNKRVLPFDFCIFEKVVIDGKRKLRPVLLIEFDGIQHFKPRGFGSGRRTPEEYLEMVRKNDLIKQTWAFKKKVSLIRIPYWDIDNIDRIMKEVLNNENI